MSTTEIKKYVTPQSTDVLAGRSNIAFTHEGNERLRERIVEHLEEYKNCASRIEKTKVIRRVIGKISAEGGRFLRHDKIAKRWYDAGFKEAHVKISHSFRDAVIPNKVKCLAKIKKSMKGTSEMLRPRSPASLPSIPVTWKPLRHRYSSVGHFDELAPKYGNTLREPSNSTDNSSLASSSVLTEDFLSVPSHEACRFSCDTELDAIPSHHSAGEILLDHEATSRGASGNLSLYDHLSSGFYEMVKNASEEESCYRQVESQIIAELGGCEEAEDLSLLPVVDLSCNDLNEVLDDLDVDDFSW